MAELCDDVEKRIRRLRKKLIQIEKLEIVSRPLNHEEIVKVGRKLELRELLKCLLKDIEMKRCAVREQSKPDTSGPTQPIPEKIPKIVEEEQKELKLNRVNNVSESSGSCQSNCPESSQKPEDRPSIIPRQIVHTSTVAPTTNYADSECQTTT